MSLSKQMRDDIRNYILTKIAAGEKSVIPKTRDAYHISDTSVRRYLLKMLDEGIIEKNGTQYQLKEKRWEYKIDLCHDAVREEAVYGTCIYPNIAHLDKNITEIWSYCFTEMMNNVIDHSQAAQASILIRQDAANTTITLHDDGIGIFRKIADYYHYPALEDAVVELFKGKLTTNAAEHTGEGIFFTSLALDLFVLISDGLRFSRNDLESDTISALNDAPQPGTTVLMRLANNSKKRMVEVFDQFSSIEGGYTKTLIPLKSIFTHNPVSRSEAKRLTARLESFEEVILDFDGVAWMGQGFADELFVRYPLRHPEVRLTVRNAGDDIGRMYYHVTGKHIE